MANKKSSKSEEPKVEAEVTKLAVEAAEQEQAVISEKRTTAKAGKRSAKALEAAEAKVEKEQRKQTDAIEASDEDRPRQAVKPTRSRLERRGKAYRKAAENIDRSKTYTIDEAIAMASKLNPTKFDASVELHVRLNVDPRQAEQNIRDSVLLPAGSGKKVRVAAFVDSEDVATAEKAGADIVGEDAIIKLLDSGSIQFDVLIATPKQMPKLGRYARLLGPRGLMPNPKSGTVTTDITKAISESKAGKVEYRVDSGGNIHLPVGKVSFETKKLKQNLDAVLASVQANKPANIKGSYILSAHLSTTMGPSISVSL